METTLRDGIEWVGYVDWTVRDFHGYKTDRGSTYNAYFIRDEKTVAIDSVKAPFAGQLIEKLEQNLGGRKLDYLVCNHAEPDHSGSIPALVEHFGDVTVICNAKCRTALTQHYNTDGWTIKVVAPGDTISIGRRTLQFADTPMAHWPESMMTYVPEEKLLFAMDAFGQHYASAFRFDDQEPLNIVMAEAKTYYANILTPYGKQVARALETAAGLDIETIAPSHGVIWRSHIPAIIEAYKKWVECKPVPKVLVVYDTMWKSTEQMAVAILEGAIDKDVDARLINVRTTHITELATEVLDAAAIAVGSATLNRTLMPQVAAALTYLKGLRPAGKAGFAFGSYGWAKGGQKEVEDYLRTMKFEILHEPLHSQFRPSEALLEECRQAGRVLGAHAAAITS